MLEHLPDDHLNLSDEVIPNASWSMMPDRPDSTELTSPAPTQILYHYAMNGVPQEKSFLYQIIIIILPDSILIISRKIKIIKI